MHRTAGRGDSRSHAPIPQLTLTSFGSSPPEGANILQALLEGAFEPGVGPEADPAEPTLAERLVAGGYPEPLARSPRRARQWHRQYLRAIIERTCSPCVTSVCSPSR